MSAPCPSLDQAEGFAHGEVGVNDEEALVHGLVTFDAEEAWVGLEQERVQRVEDGRGNGGHGR